MKTRYITTPIYYVNDKPHIGHAYTTISADVLARVYRLRGFDVLFSVGVDENSQKNVEAMEKMGETDLQIYLDRMSGTWKQTWDDLGITYNTFIRTTSAEHRVAVDTFWNLAKQSGDIYEGTYKGLYCVGCEAFKTETEVENDRCPLHPNKDLQSVEEKNYFFRASAYREALLNHIQENPEFVQPESRRNEILNYVKDHFEDFSISREAKYLNVGIPVPGDDSQRIYVWFDALINYLTVAGFGTDNEKFKKWWPANLHLVGKDIIKFHCALWPAMLLCAKKQNPDLSLPLRVFAHGFFTTNGQKISKSLGNAIDPHNIVATYGNDTLRYFLLREISFGEDGDFSVRRLKERYAHDLMNTLGNLVHRVISMSRKYFDGKIPSSLSHEKKYTFADQFGIDTLRKEVENHFDTLRFDRALSTIWGGVDEKFGLFQANQFIDETAPFKLIKEDPEAVGVILYSLLEYIRCVSWLLMPIMPNTAKKILHSLNEQEQSAKIGTDLFAMQLEWGGLIPGSDLSEPEILFPRLEE
ncbi:MAG: methionine--tRNA ligase [bacterium]|nr:methionine--tRNA ligase [bacterium]